MSTFDTIEELRAAFVEFAHHYNLAEAQPVVSKRAQDKK
jgi:hypothetical protein